MSKRGNRQAEFTKWMGPVLDALRNFSGSAKPREIYKWIGEKHQIPEKILNERYAKSGQLKFPNQIAWAKQYLVWEKLVEASKHGVWALTKKGWTTKLNEKESHDIFLHWVKVFQELRENKSSTTAKAAEKIIEREEIGEPEENPNSNPTLIEVLQNISDTGFEHLCGRLLREYDFENIEITQRSHDGGIDGYATLKLNPFVNLSAYFQCKRYKGSVPTKDVQAFIGVMETNKRSVEKGIFLTTGSFSKNAFDIEKANIKLELIDGDKLVEMFEKVELGVTLKKEYIPDLSFFEQYRDNKEKHIR